VLGNTHNEVRHDLLKSDARQLAKTLTACLCYPIAALNFGQTDLRRLPKFEFDTRETEDVELYSNALPKLVGAGMKIDRKWAQEKLMIPEPQDGAELLTIPKPEMTLPPEERPDEPSRTAAMRYRAVLTNKAGETVYADQHALDQTIDALPADELVLAMQQAIKPVIAALRNGSTPDDAFALLLEAYPKMDESALEELLTRCIFVADVWGRLNAG
jgi:phage gp29-like protein